MNAFALNPKRDSALRKQKYAMKVKYIPVVVAAIAIINLSFAFAGDGNKVEKNLFIDAPSTEILMVVPDSPNDVIREMLDWLDRYLGPVD